MPTLRNDKNLFPSPSLPSPPIPIPSEVGPLNPAGGVGEHCKLPQGVWGTVPAKIEFGAF